MATESKQTSAASQVFGVAELREKILEGLSTKDLLRAQTLNKAFKATINKSSCMQQAMFFTPVIRDVFNEEHASPRLNRVLFPINNPVFEGMRVEILDGDDYLSKEMEADCEGLFGKDHLRLTVNLPCPRIDCLMIEASKASWARMYLTKPLWPVNVRMLKPNGEVNKLKDLGGYDGITMGDVVKAIYEASMED